MQLASYLDALYNPRLRAMDHLGHIPIIDVFAGPGGLGEGFSSYADGDVSPFRIGLSVEKDPLAWETLSLRSFFRQFKYAGAPVPEEYYQHVRSPEDLSREELFAKFPEQFQAAMAESWCAELGTPATDGQLHKKIRSALGGKDRWVLIGGPPCQAYSLAGRSRNANNEDFEDDARHFLYREYLQIIAKHWPSVFVMENVKGMLSARVKGEGIFSKIQRDLSDPGGAVGGPREHTYKIYPVTRECLPDAARPEDFVVRAEEYGIPQARHRVILLGIREDMAPAGPLEQILVKQEMPVPIDSVLTLPPLRSGLSLRATKPDSWDNWRRSLRKAASARWLKDVDSSVRQQVEEALRKIADRQKELPRTSHGKGGKPKVALEWFWDDRLGGTLNHETRGHRDDDLQRYLFAACYAQGRDESLTLGDFPEGLLPKHKNVMKAVSGSGHFADRFRVQRLGRPATTITCHISKDGHYYIHPDPSQCRSLTVREAARIQTFPDNYFFCGPRTSQYHQVGNAVPPLLARQIADIVWGILR